MTTRHFLAIAALLAGFGCGGEMGDPDDSDDSPGTPGAPDADITGGGDESGDVEEEADAGPPKESEGETPPPPPPTVDPGIEKVGSLKRFDLAIPDCTRELLTSGAGCPSGDDKCLCKPEFDALNPQVGSPGNPSGRVVIISQPKYGKNDDGTFVYDAYAAIKAKGNTVGHYVNAMNPDLTCTAAESWAKDKGCTGGAGCGWRCQTGAARADKIIEAQVAAYGSNKYPELIALNEAWSTIYEDSTPGVKYRTWIRDLTKRLKERGRLPLLYVQERHVTAGPYTLLSETAQYALIGVEAYLSGREILNAPNRCAAPYDSTNWCFQQYREMRNSVRNSASPVIPYGRLVMVEHFANNNWRFTDANGAQRTASWGRSYDSGSPTTSAWEDFIGRRARAMKALGSLGGVASYAWGGNGSGTGSMYRVKAAAAYSAVPLP